MPVGYSTLYASVGLVFIGSVPDRGGASCHTLSTVIQCNTVRHCMPVEYSTLYASVYKEQTTAPRIQTVIMVLFSHNLLPVLFGFVSRTSLCVEIKACLDGRIGFNAPTLALVVHSTPGATTQKTHCLGGNAKPGIRWLLPSDKAKDGHSLCLL